MVEPLSQFVSFTINPNEQKMVTIPELGFLINSISFHFEKEIPNTGRVVVHMAPINEDNKIGKFIAIAPLTVGKFEVASVDFQLAPFSSVVFKTTGDKIPINIIGSIDVEEHLILSIYK